MATEVVQGATGATRERRSWQARLARWAWPGHPERWRDVPRRLRPTLEMTIRLTVGAVLSYLATLLLTDGAVDLTGALTAILVMQASAYSTIKSGLVRIGAVLGGVLVATLLSTWIGLTWWSLGAAIAAALLIGKVFRLGDHALETPISAMLILAVTNPDVAAEIRVVTTLIGAGVGVAFNLIYPPAMPTSRALRSIVAAADATAVPLESAAGAFEAGPVRRSQVAHWQQQAHEASVRVGEASSTIKALHDARRLNTRALGVVDIEPILASGLATLDDCLLAVRALLAVIRSELPRDRGDGDPEAAVDGDPYGDELRNAFSVVLSDVADCLRGFGRLVVAEADGRERQAEQELDGSLEVLRETQAVLAELLLTTGQHSESWLLRGSTLVAVKQVLDQLDLEDRARARRAWREAQQHNPIAHLPPIVQAALPHPDRPTLRGLPEGSPWWHAAPEAEQDAAAEGPDAEAETGSGSAAT